MRIAWFPILILSLALVSQVFACGKERWPVKTATDKDKGAIVEHATPATINQLRVIAAPRNPNIKPDRRRGPTELTVYEITGKLKLIKKEADEDYHVVILDEKGRSMIVESVAPGCAEGRRFGADIKAARDAIDTKFGAITGRKTISQMATVTGVGFFDRIHGQKGVAPNGIELHPILDIAFHDEKDHAALRRRVHSRKEED